MKYVASCSFGKDSLAMVIRLLKEGYPLDEVVYFDIGVDFKCIRENAEKMRLILREKGIKFTILEPAINVWQKTANGYEMVHITGKDVFNHFMLHKHVEKRNGETQCGYMWCGGTTRWGTTLKLDTITTYNEMYGDETVVEYIGVAFDEKHRINRERCDNRVKLYPLVEWGMTEKDCLEYCYKNGWHWYENGYELYSLLDRVSCKYCKNKNLKELRNIYHFLPDVWQELKDLQDKIHMPFKGNKTIHDLETRFINEDAQMSIEDFISV